MPKSTRVLRKLLLVFSLLNILMCPITFFGMMFFPQGLRFLSPVLCPPGMHLGNETMSESDLRGNVTATYTICTDGHQDVDVTGKALVILFGLPILGIILLVIWALADSGKTGERST